MRFSPGLRLLLFWMLFALFVVLMLGLDLWVFHRPAHAVKLGEAVVWSLVWILLAAGFVAVLYFWQGHAAALEFGAGYLVELSLSVDNLFIFLVIFRYFQVPADHQHKVLFWGIVGALIMRAIFVVVGIGLIREFHWILYAFGVFLIYSGVKLWREEDTSIEPEKNPVLRLFRKWVPVTENYEGESFFVRRPRLYATPLLAVLLFVETTDLLFATDSIPAVLGITQNAFIVYTSNIFAVLGLRAMYFVLSGMMDMFRYLHYGLALVLIFIGAKMLVSHYYQVPTVVALSVVAAVLMISVLASVVLPRKSSR